jgi:hypothetical protein
LSAAAPANSVSPANQTVRELFSIGQDGVDDPLLDSAAVLRLLRNRVPGLATRRVTHCAVWPLKCRFRSRRVLAIDLTVAGPHLDQTTTLHWIAKKHREGAGAVAEFRALTELIRAGFGTAGEFRVPRPISLVPDWRLFVEERAPGSALRNFLGHPGSSRVRRAAQWLRQLHSLPPARQLNCPYDAERVALDVFSENLRSRQPELARYLDRQGARLRDQMADWRAIPATWVHGDFHPENIYLSDEAVTVIDFDRFAMGDPAKDLGSFITQVRAMSFFSGLPARSAHGKISAFLEEYVGEIPTAEARPLRDRVEAYSALFALEVAYYTLCVLRVSDPDFARKWFQYGIALQHGTARAPGGERTQEQTVE